MKKRLFLLTISTVLLLCTTLFAADEGLVAWWKFDGFTTSVTRKASPVVKNWGEAQAALKINGKAVERGKNFRYGHRQTLQGTDLIVWIKTESVEPLRISIAQNKS